MRGLSSIITGIAPSATLEISDKARQLQQQGLDVISLSIGEPDFDTPAHIKDACIQALMRGETHYVPSNGIPELVSAIAGKTEKENKIPCTPGQVIVTCGAKDAIYDAMAAVLNPGDEVIILDPSWVSYEPCVRMAGGRPVHHLLDTRTFQLDDSVLEKVTQKTRMVIVNSPSNPSGAVLDKSSLGVVADMCEDYDLLSLSDEIYEKLIYGKKHIALASIGDMAQRTITVNGFSKAYAMTGWRLGWAVAPQMIINQMSKVQQHSISHPTTFAMYGGVAALTSDQSCVETMRKEFNRRRDYLVQELLLMGHEVAPADGAFYAYVKTGGDDLATARIWLEKGQVAVTPGSAFNTPGWQRISYATSMERLHDAVIRIRSLS
ncbi:MAG: pyridoxal phosphate-dependent aminotransferase [Methanoregulaceae archaeon]|jgi:aspartate aminotransferase|nr:pyridoxal phosphate-dependent aminotransferase [Methanoregulaceae archaeon]MCU0628791.1 pyridoxal phosphate-dependent aminotransferase [Methanoregulaceae archaeon]